MRNKVELHTSVNAFIVFSLLWVMSIIVTWGSTYTESRATRDNELLVQYCMSKNARYQNVDIQHFCIDLKNKTITEIDWYSEDK